MHPQNIHLKTIQIYDLFFLSLCYDLQLIVIQWMVLIAFSLWPATCLEDKGAFDLHRDLEPQ